MKKAFDQTVRDLKREVNKKVLKVPGLEQKVLDATSNESWGPHGSHLADIAQATRNFHEYQMIMAVLWKRVNDTGKNWRHVYKALTVLEYLVAHGSERVIDEIKEHAYQISTLSDFQYIDSSGRDQGSNVRKKSQSLVALVNDKERVREVRHKAYANREKFRTSTGGMHKSTSYSYSRSGEGYGDGYNDDVYEGRYGSRDDERNGYGRERDEDRYGRGGDCYSRDGDHFSRDSNEHYNREDHRDNDYKAHSNGDSQTGYQCRSSDGERNRSGDEDNRHSSSAPPSYEEAVSDDQNNPSNDRAEGSIGGTVHTASPQTESTSKNQSPNVTPVTSAPDNKGVSDFDEFDPRGSFSAAPASSNIAEKDLLGSLLDPSSPMVSTTTAPSGAHAFPDPGYTTPFGSLSPAPNALNQPSAEDFFGDFPFSTMYCQEPAHSQAQSSVPTDTFPSGPTEVSGTLDPPEAKVETIDDFGFGESFQTLTYPPGPVQPQAHPEFQLTNQPIQPSTQQYLQPTQQPPQPYLEAGTQFQQPPHAYLQPLPHMQQSPDQYTQAMSQMPSHGSLQPLAQVPPLQHTQQSLPYVQQPQPYLQSQPQSLAQLQPQQSGDVLTDLLPQSAPRVKPASQPAGQIDTAAKLQAPMHKFEPKSAVWADTLSRGLVDLNISGPKTNPLADIGIDFDSINRMDKRREKEKEKSVVPSTSSMGKAMGAGSGIGRAGATGLAPPPNTMVGAGMGMGMGNGPGMGMGMRMGMGMGNAVGMGMGNGVGMGMGMGVGNGVGMGMGMGVGNGVGMGMGMGSYAFGMNQSMGMGMGAPGIGAPIQPGVGMPPSGPGGTGYNPMMSMGGYCSTNPYGGYR